MLAQNNNNAPTSPNTSTDSLAQKVKVDYMPFFAGCSAWAPEDKAKRRCSDENLGKFITEHLEYPPQAIAAALQGKVIVSFLVDENGAVAEAKVLRDIGMGCGEAALAVINAMPRWEPGLYQGNNVKVRLTLPVGFTFKTSLPNEGMQYSIHWGQLRGDKLSKTLLKACLDEKIYVRDAFGNAANISELEFVYEKKRKTTEAHASGSTPNKKMRKIAQKVAIGGVFTISATVQQAGKFIIVQKSFQIE